MVIEKENPKTLKIVSRILLNDGVVILPSDTLYGFSCIQGKAEKIIEKIKGRGSGKHFLKLALSDQLDRLTVQKPSEKFLSVWPGPLTLIMQGIKNSTEGIRVPDNDFIQCVLKEVGQPIISTSVNYSGQPAMNDIVEIIREFEDKVELIVDGGVLKPSLPSTIIDISGKKPVLIRQGQIRIENIEQSFSERG